MNKAVFLDRDGVINVDFGYVHKVEDFKFIPRSLPALKRLSKSPYLIIIITDQSGIGRGYYTQQDADKVHDFMLHELSKKGVVVKKIYGCPHSPEDDCKCRKPKTEMLKRAKKDFDVKLTSSYFIGDKTKDIKTGTNAGCKTILVLTGKAGKDCEYKVKPHFVANDLYDAVDYILDNEQKD